MNVWFDGQCLQTASRYRGIGRYVQELIRALANREGVRLSISFNAAMVEEALAAREAVSPWIAAHDIHMWESEAEGGEYRLGMTSARRLGAVALAHHVAMLAPDVAVSASPFEGGGDSSMPLEPGLDVGAPVASIFYDAIPHRFPDRYLADPTVRAAYERRLALLSRYDLNLCISAYSAREAQAIAGAVDCVDIGAGVSPDFLTHLDAPQMPTPQEPYILYVGGLDWRKNVAAVPDAFALLAPELRERARFVVAGDHSKGDIDDLRRRWRFHGLRRDGFVALNHVTDAELVSLYRRAAATVQPSYLEGFGLTMLEAMTCGCPVIASDRGAAPEVVRNPDVMFDPDDHARLAALIARMIEDAPFRRNAVASGVKLAKEFSWDRTAEIVHVALAGLAARARVPRRNLGEVRDRARRALEGLVIEPERVAEVMARAEPVATGPGRLFVDCTALLQHDGGTGIQRVTRQIARRLARSHGATLIYGDDDVAFRALETGDGDPTPPCGWMKATPVTPRCDDTFLMLDSSWAHSASHRPHLWSARLRGAQVVSTLYDLVPLTLPAFTVPGMPEVFRSWLMSALGYSTGFVCISRAVAQELHDLLAAIAFPRPMKIGWWPLGADFRVGPRTARGPILRRRFLMVGTIEPRKGYDVALAAFDRLWAQEVDFDVTIIGRRGWSTEGLVARMEAHPELGSRLRLICGASDEELAEAYAETDVLISASHAEGFGLPLIEARHFGKPVIVSDLPVFREVTEGAHEAFFFTGGDPAALAEAIRRYMAERGEQPTAQSADVDWPDWDESARRLTDLLNAAEWGLAYRPAQPKLFAGRGDVGGTRMTALLGAAERNHRTEFLSSERRGRGLLRTHVRITNLSGALWSSNLDEDEALGFVLTAQGFDSAGAPVGARGEATLPFVLPDGWSATLALELREAASVASVAFQLRQRCGEGWGVPLCVDI